MVFGGIAAIVLSVLIWREWRVSGAWAIGILVGVRLLTSGRTMMMLGSLGEMAADEL